MMFYTAIEILNLGHEEVEPSDANMIRIFGVLSLDAFVSQYQIQEDDLMLQAYDEANSRKLLIGLFFASTFLIQIVFLNMLIAIMGDAFGQAVDNKENNRKSGMLKIMAEYIELTVQYG